MATGSQEPFHLLETIDEPRGMFSVSMTPNPNEPEVCIAGLPWGGEQSTGHAPGPDPDAFYDDHYQAH